MLPSKAETEANLILTSSTAYQFPKLELTCLRNQNPALSALFV